MRGAHLTGWSIALVAVLSAGASVTAAERQSELAARGEVSRSKVPLVEAVQQRNTASVRALLGRGVDVNASEPDGTTALHWAAHQGDLDVLDLLLGAGVNVRAANRYGVTPLPLACENGNAAVIERLLIAGADPNVVLPGGQTALMTAARTGRADAVKVLLAHGADANATEGLRGQTALMWAAANGHAAAAAVLLAGGSGPGCDVPWARKGCHGARHLRAADERSRTTGRIYAVPVCRSGRPPRRGSRLG